MGSIATPDPKSNCGGVRCGYRHYRAVGADEIGHDGYHAALDEQAAASDRYLDHIRSCPACEFGDCSAASRLVGSAAEWDRRVRA